MKINENILRADDGMVLTNGNAYAKAVYLAAGAEAAEWREVSEAERTHSGGDEF